MAGGRIQNRTLLQRAGDDLNVEGVKRAPAHLNLEQVLMTYELGRSQPAELFSLQQNLTFQSLAGASAVNQGLVGTPTLLSGAMIVNPDFDCWLAGIEVTVTYNAGGALADHGIDLMLGLRRYASQGGASTPFRGLFLQKWAEVVSSVLSYPFFYGTQNAYSVGVPSPAFNLTPTMANNYIPAGDGLALEIARSAGGTFPAGTQVNIHVMVYTRTRQAWVQFVPPA